MTQQVTVRQVLAEIVHTAPTPQVTARQVLAEVAHIYRGTGPQVRVRQVLAEVAWTPLAGELYAVGNDLGEYDGDDRGVPLSSDRSAWDDVAYPERHARGMAAGDSHHPEVTLGEGSDPILTLEGQELTLGDVATQAELDAHTDAETGAHAASAVSYDNAASGLTADDVQAAIDELADDVAGLPGTDTDEKIKVSANDTTPGYLSVKLVEGDNVTLTETGDGGNETLVLSAVRPANPMTTAGDIIYGGADGIETRLPIGDPGEYLRVNAGGTMPEWGASPTITWEASPVTDGVTKDVTTSTDVGTVSARMYVFQPLKITNICLDVTMAGTYNMYLTSGPRDTGDTPITEIIHIVAEDAVSAAGGDLDFTPSTPLVLLPGVYWVSVEREEGACEYNTASAEGCALYYQDQIYHDGTPTASGGMLLPLFITAYRGTWAIA